MFTDLICAIERLGNIKLSRLLNIECFKFLDVFFAGLLLMMILHVDKME